MASVFDGLLRELAAAPYSPTGAVRTLIDGIRGLVDEAVAHGSLNDVRELAEELGRQAESLTAAVAGAEDASTRPALTGHHDAPSLPTDPETFEV